MLVDKQKDKPTPKNKDSPQLPQAVPVIDTTELQEKLKKEEAAEKRRQEKLQKERAERRRCGCW